MPSSARVPAMRRGKIGASLSPPTHASLRSRLVVVLLALPLSLPAQSASGRRGVTAEDYFGFIVRGRSAVSPDGSQVVYVSSRVDRARNRRVPSIWIVADGRQRRRRDSCVDEAWSASAPRWSPDGKAIAFTSGRVIDRQHGHDRDAAARARVARSSGRSRWRAATPRRVSNVANGVSSCSWSPNGTQFVCLVADRAERHAEHRPRAQRRPALHEHQLQVQRHRLVRRQALAPLGHRRRVGRGASDHERRRVERHGSAVVAGRLAHRVRVRSHGQGVRRGAQQRHLDRPGRPAGA